MNRSFDKPNYVKLPALKTVTPTRMPDSGNVSTLGSTTRRRERSLNFSMNSELAEEVARNRYGSVDKTVPTLGLFQASFLSDRVQV